MQFGKLEPFADSVWTATTPIRFAGIWFPHVMSIIRLNNDQLVLHSPCQPLPSLLGDIARLGKVAHVIAPNWFHDLYLTKYRSLYVDANFCGPLMLRRWLGSAIINSELDQSSLPPWFEEMPHFTLSGLLTFNESIFFHRRTGTLIVADLLTNLYSEGSTPSLTRFMYRLTRIDHRLTMLPYLRWFGMTVVRALRQAAEQIVEWNPDRLIVGHGTPITSDAAGQLRSAMRSLIKG